MISPITLGFYVILAYGSLAIFFPALIYLRFANRCPHCGKIKQSFGPYCPYCGKKIN